MFSLTNLAHKGLKRFQCWARKLHLTPNLIAATLNSGVADHIKLSEMTISGCSTAITCGYSEGHIIVYRPINGLWFGCIMWFPLNLDVDQLKYKSLLHRHLYSLHTDYKLAQFFLVFKPDWMPKVKLFLLWLRWVWKYSMKSHSTITMLL